MLYFKPAYNDLLMYIMPTIEIGIHIAMVHIR